MADPTPFAHAHASHSDWRVACAQCLDQLSKRRRSMSSAVDTLGFLYLTDEYGPYASDILTTLRVALGVADWVGTAGIGICATDQEYFDEPAMAVMLAEWPIGSFSVFSDKRPAPASDKRTSTGAIAAHAALVHADPAAPDLPDLLVDMAGKVESGWVFGGLSSARKENVQIANETLTGDGVYGSGLSGAVFSSEVHMLARVTQGCHPLRSREGYAITEGEQHIIETLDGRPALDVLLDELDTQSPHDLIRHPKLRGGLFVGLDAARSSDAPRTDDYLVRHVVALDPNRRAIGIAGDVERGQRLMFCTRDATAAQHDLVRICTELRDEVERETTASKARRSIDVREDDAAANAPPFDSSIARIRGALYFSCVGRGATLFGEQGEELRLIRKHLGDVPLVGFFANGEIARHRLYGYTGVLTVFI